MRFNKPPLSYNDQIDQLVKRGLNCDNRDNAHQHLTHINYYRLAAYWWPYQKDYQTHQFKDGASFDIALEKYIFDRELRLLLLDAIERFEVSLRTGWAYHVSHRYGPHGILNRMIFKQTSRHWDYGTQLNKLKEDVQNSRELFIKHFRQTYDEPVPPLWALVKIMTFGQLSKWLINLKVPKDRQLIADRYQVDEKVLCSFLLHLNYVRNICAHHCRLWNRELTFTFKLPRSGNPSLRSAFNDSHHRRIHNTIQMLAYLMDLMCPGHTWRDRVTKLLGSHPGNLRHMGFPPGFKLEDFKAYLVTA